LLTTTLTPWSILWAKLIAGLRVSSVLTGFLLWPVLLACLMVSAFWTNFGAVVAWLAIVGVTCLTTAMVALFCSVLARKTSIAQMASYLVIVVLFCAPPAIDYFADTFFQSSEGAKVARAVGVSSPFKAAMAVPFEYVPDRPDRLDDDRGRAQSAGGSGSWPTVAAYLGFSVALNGALLGAMIWLFNRRWRVAG